MPAELGGNSRPGKDLPSVHRHRGSLPQVQPVELAGVGQLENALLLGKLHIRSVSREQMSPSGFDGPVAAGGVEEQIVPLQLLTGVIEGLAHV